MKKAPSSTVTPAQNQTALRFCLPSSPSSRGVLIPCVLIPVSNFTFLDFLDQAFFVLLPLVFSTPLELDGLTLSPPTIGSILGRCQWGVLNGFVQVFVFPWLAGHRKLFVARVAGLGIGLGMFPILNWIVRMRGGDSDGGAVGCVGLVCGQCATQLGSYMFTYMSYDLFSRSLNVISLLKTS